MADPFLEKYNLADTGKFPQCEAYFKSWLPARDLYGLVFNCLRTMLMTLDVYNRDNRFDSLSLFLAQSVRLSCTFSPTMFTMLIKSRFLMAHARNVKM